ncbi:MAG TPA: hypothetical protein PK710_17055, partial [Polyangiaceae bacterium]|nr:hypothetical protein [Polyangiaceae bacterium]
MNNRANNSDGRGELSSDSVTSHDLMMFADGELDAQREAAVASYLRENETGRAVVSTVWEMGARIRELQDRKAIDAGADGIASLVMARIEQEASAPRKENVVPLVTSERRAVGFGPVVVGGLALAAGVALLVWRLVGMDLTQPIPEKTAGALSSEKPVSVSALSTED